LARVPRVVLRTRARTERRSRRSFFNRRQLLDRSAAARRSGATGLLPSMRGREPRTWQAFRLDRARAADAPTAWTAQRGHPADRANDLGKEVFMPWLRGGGDRGSTSGPCEASLRGWGDRPRALCLRAAWAVGGDRSAEDRVLGSRSRRVANASPLDQRHRRRPPLSPRSRLAARLVTAQTRRAGGDGGRGIRPGRVRHVRGGVRVRGRRLRDVSPARGPRWAAHHVGLIPR